MILWKNMGIWLLKIFGILKISHPLFQHKGVNIQGHMSSVHMHSDYIDLDAHNLDNL